MQQSAWVMALFLVAWSWVAAPSYGAAEGNPAPELDASYVIGPGDVLDISDWKNQDLTRVVTVLPDGTISFPLIGEVRATGKTVTQFKADLEKEIRRFVPDPVLSIIVQQVNSMLVYVIGKVNRPDRFVLNGNVDVMQALAMAGGLNPFAKKDMIRILRKSGEETQVLAFNYDDVSQGVNLTQNVGLMRGDVIVVP